MDKEYAFETKHKLKKNNAELKKIRKAIKKADENGDREKYPHLYEKLTDRHFKLYERNKAFKNFK